MIGSRCASVAATSVALLFPLTAAAQGDTSLRLVEEFRFGAVTGERELTRVSAILPSPDGRRVYIGQPQDARVLIVDVEAREVLRAIGRRGRGPGEFDGLSRLGWRGDSLYVVDRILGRVAFFSPDGDHLQTQRMVSSEPMASAHALPTALAPDGTVIGSGRINMAAAARGRTTANPLVRMTREGEILGTFADGDFEDAFYSSTEGERITVGMRPFANRERRGVAPGGSTVVVVEIGTLEGGAAVFSLTRMRFDGDTLYRRTFRFQSRAVPSEIRDSMVDAGARWRAERYEVSPGRARQLAEEGLQLPETQTPVDAVVVGEDGTVWLKRERTAVGVAHWQVLDPEGRVRGIVAAPDVLRIQYVNGDTVWGVVPGAFDEPYVVGYRLEQTATR